MAVPICREQARDQSHEQQGEGRTRQVDDPEARHKAYDHHQQALNDGHGGASQRSPEHDLKPRNGSHKSLLQKPNWRSHSNPIPEKIELNSTVMAIAPGATNCR